MKTRPLLVALALLLISVLLLPAAAAKGRRAGKAKATVIGRDAQGDWGSASSAPEAAPLGAELGQDLIRAALQRKGRKLNFIIKVTNLPPFGGWPEVTRYVWGFEVNRKFFELDGKFTNYSRGACDPTSSQCPPPRDPGMSPFLLRGNCTTTQNVTTCEEIGIVNATFNAESGTITIPVPMKLIKARRGSRIVPAASEFSGQVGGPIIAIPSAFLSSSGAPSDAIQTTKVFKVR